MWQLTSLAGFSEQYLLDAGNPCGQQLAVTLLRDYRHATAPIAAVAIATDISEGPGAERGYLEEGPEARAQANVGYDLNKLSCGGDSFTSATRVLLPGGKTVAIARLKPGDKVLAADTKTGKDQAETVTALEVNHDTDLFDLTIKTNHGTEVIDTTANHLFWDPGKHQWVKAASLRKGEPLRTSGSTATAYAVSGHTPANHQGWMWDITIPGNSDHDFNVLPGQPDSYNTYDVEAVYAPGSRSQ